MVWNLSSLRRCVNDMMIYDFLTVNKPEGYRSDCALPDHALLGDGAASSWVAGAYEGLMMRSLYSIRRQPLMNYLLARKVRRQIVKSSEENRTAMHKALIKASALAIVDPLISFLSGFNLDREAVAAEARHLATETEHRELVKVGIALLGTFGKMEDIETILLPLGRHEEFTFYVAPAVRALMGDDRNAVLLPLADAVDGWGRLAVLYELNFADPAVKDYLLRFGCRNRLGLAEAANLCATKGDLAGTLEALAAGEALPDAELYQGLCDILTGLLVFDGVHDSIQDYKHGHRAQVAFVVLTQKYRELAGMDPRTEEILKKMR
ncbi:MAG: hypothetical protein IKU26_01325 [Clostridia bacterium]|nr:hypothetical protein [Clostridia bacterium]